MAELYSHSLACPRDVQLLPLTWVQNCPNPKTVLWDETPYRLIISTDVSKNPVSFIVTPEDVGSMPHYVVTFRKTPFTVILLLCLGNAKRHVQVRGPVHYATRYSSQDKWLL